MKRCPECRRDYFDESLAYCLDDGAALIQGSMTDEPATAILSSSSVSSESPTRRVTESNELTRSGRGKLLVGALIALVVVAGAGAYFAFSGKHSPNIGTGVVRFPITVPEKKWFAGDVEQHNAAISPDGRKVVFTLWSEGKSVLFVRSLDQVESKPLAGTDKAFSPFWSPDSQTIAFFADGKLRKIDANGGAVQTICDVTPGDTVGTWGTSGTILYLAEGENDSEFLQVSAAGGSPSKAYSVDGIAPTWPHFLPDGRHFLFYGRVTDPSSSMRSGIFVGVLGSNEAKLIVETPRTRVEYIEPGYIMYVREGSLLAQKFDLSSLGVSGDPSVVLESVNYFDKTGWSEWSASQTGALVFPSQLSLSRLVWLDRNGREVGRIGNEDLFTDIRFSPDGAKFCATISDVQTASGNIWIYDLNGTRSRFAFGPLDESSCVWSPDGRRIAYFTNGKSSLRIKDVSDVGGEGESPIEEGFIGVSDWSRDGKYIIYALNDPTVERDIWILPIDGDRKPFPFLKTPASEWGGHFSPDGRYVAYMSDESGTQEIYVASFSEPGRKVRVSTAGGAVPIWSRDGKELFYLAGDGPLMAVSFADGKAGTPEPLFDATNIMDYSVSLDGKKFLVVQSVPGVLSAPLNVMLNWPAALKK